MTEQNTARAAEPEATYEETLENVATVTERRGETYAFLSRLYRVEADAKLIDDMRAMRFPAKTGNEKLNHGYRLLSRYMARPRDGQDLELAVDYTRTFIGSGVDGRSAAYPFESVYTSEFRLIRQDARDEVLAVYRSEGLNKSADWHDEEDHVGIELEFMSMLCERAVEALRAGDEQRALELFATQRGFLEAHLLNWVPMLTADMRTFAKTDLYQGLAGVTDGFLETDRDFLAELLDGGAQTEPVVGNDGAEPAACACGPAGE